MGKAKMGGMSQFSMESCGEGCRAKSHCASILQIVKAEQNVEFRTEPEVVSQ